ncbi:MAG: nucleoside deaminase [Clostridia bacterium]|nr:nucleoside deaminase [Clostridia bacterium]
MTDEYYMSFAIGQAKNAGERGEAPVGAVVVRNGEIIGYGGNDRESAKSCFGHAEINAIKQAQKKTGDWRLDGCTIYVTLEPCAMCAGAIINARIDRVVYGAADEKAGCMGSRINLAHCSLGCSPRITAGVMRQECEALLRNFFGLIR